MQPVPLLRETDDLERQNTKLLRIVDVLMNRVEITGAENGSGYAHFQAAVALEAQVRSRTRDLEDALAQLNLSRSRLSAAMLEAETARADLSNALEAVKEGFGLFGPDGLLIMSNSRFSRMLPDVVSRIQPGLSFDDYTDLIANSSVLVPQEGMSRQEWRDERRRHHATHDSFVVQLTGDRWVQVSEHPTPNGGTAILQTDVTDMVRLERQERTKLLDAQARMVRATLDHIKQGVCIFDAEDRLAGWNNRLMDLISPPMDLLRIGTSFDSLARHLSQEAQFQDTAAARKVINWVRHRQQRSALRAEVQRPGGPILDVFGQNTPDLGFVISFTDITAERAANAALQEAKDTLEQRVEERTAQLALARDAAERANVTKSRFLAAASHDLLQPLNAAKLFISSLESSDLDPQQRDITGRIKNSFDSVEGILGALLDISKLDAEPTANVTVFPLRRLFAPIRDEFQAIAKGRGLRFQVVDCGLDVESDAAYLRRIVQNLVSNAIAYTDSGKILLGARRRGDMLRIEVHDTGSGIPEDQKEAVFREFHRLKQTSEMGTGMGLGLAIVQRACALLNHDIRLESAVGRGTSFYVEVPYRVPSGPPAGPAAADMPKHPFLDDLLALVLENERSVRLAMVTLLDSWGASPIEAESLRGAEEILDEIGLAPDVILADYHLDDGENGLDAIGVLRGLHGPVPAVLITADRTDAIIKRAKAENVAVLHKPLQPQKLRSLLGWVRSGV